MGNGEFSRKDGSEDGAIRSPHGVSVRGAGALTALLAALAPGDVLSGDRNEPGHGWMSSIGATHDHDAACGVGRCVLREEERCTAGA